MPGKFSFEGCEVFRHHRPIEEEDMRSRILNGMDGAFREFLREEGSDTDTPSLGVVVQHTVRGAIQGSRIVKCGRIKAAPIHTKDMWPEAEDGSIVFPDFDLGMFSEVNGMLISGWDEIPFKTKVQSGKVLKTVKEGERKDRGFGSIVMRVMFVPVTLEKARFVIQALPFSKDTMVQLGEETRSRSFGGIKVHSGVADSHQSSQHRGGVWVGTFEPQHLKTSEDGDQV